MSYFTLDQVASVLKLRRETVSRMAKRGDIPCIRTSSGPKARFRFLASDVYELAKKSEVDPAKQFLKALTPDPKPIKPE